VKLIRKDFPEFGCSFLVPSNPNIEMNTSRGCDGVCYKTLGVNTRVFSPSLEFRVLATVDLANKTGEDFNSERHMKIHYQDGKGGFIWDPSWKIIPTQIGNVPATITSGCLRIGFPEYFDRLLIVKEKRMWEISVERQWFKWNEKTVQEILNSMIINDADLTDPVCERSSRKAS
jgi:hypothetical protein